VAASPQIRHQNTPPPPHLDILGATQPLDTCSALAAAVCLVAWYCHGLIVYRSPTIDMHFPVRLLHTALESALLQSDSGESLTNLKLRLWLYFVGAMAEKQSGKTPGITRRESPVLPSNMSLN
jgi:hypothetical protein